MIFNNVNKKGVVWRILIPALLALLALFAMFLLMTDFDLGGILSSVLNLGG